jgi:AmiR/NasT family two-component response regulator
VIEQAKGVIAQYRSANMEQVFALLRGFSRDHNLLMTEVARQIVEGQIDPTHLTKTN